MKKAFAILILVLPVVCGAQEELNDNRQIEKRPDVNAAMTETVYNRLSAIHDMMGEDRLGEALTAIEKLERQRLSKYEEALVKQTKGFVYAQQNREAQAIQSFEAALKTNSLPPTAHQGMLYSLAGLYASQDQFMKSIETMREWFRYEAEPIPDAYIMIGSGFAELERFDNALPYVLKAIEKSKEPRKAWYMLAIAIHFERSRYAAAADLLLEMLRYWPDEARYWDMLSSCYLELNDDQRALDTMMVAYNSGMLTNPIRILALVQLNLMRDIPYTAGTILQDELGKGTLERDEDNLRLLLQAWLSAREYDRAVETIDRLSEFAENGDYYLQAARIYNETGEWQKVINNVVKALDAGLDEPVDALMLQGIANAELDRFDDAERAFIRVRSLGDSSDRRNAGSWIAFVDEKRQLQNAKVGSN